MKWYENLYVGKTVEKKKESLIRGLEEGKPVPGCWVILLPETESNQLEIIPAWNLKFWHRQEGGARVVGLAGSKEEAVGLLEEITQDVLRGTGTAGIRAWFSAQSSFVQM